MIYTLAFLLAMQGDPLSVQIRKAVQTGDSYAIGEIMTRRGDPRTVARLFTETARDIYWKDHDLPAFVELSRRGIDYCLTHAAEVEKTDTSLAQDLRGAAKTISYNLASFLWPGWDEPGVKLSAADITIGFEAARLNLRLGAELQRGPEPMSSAHWMVGAFSLATGDHASAIASFEKSRDVATAGNLQANALLATGYIGITRAAGKIDAPRGEKELADAKAALASEKIQDGPFFADQLATAYRVFVKK
jgi:hypothetical protein